MQYAAYVMIPDRSKGVFFILQEAGISNPVGSAAGEEQPPPYQANYGSGSNVPPTYAGNSSGKTAVLTIVSYKRCLSMNE